MIGLISWRRHFEVICECCYVLMTAMVEQETIVILLIIGKTEEKVDAMFRAGAWEEGNGQATVLLILLTNAHALAERIAVAVHWQINLQICCL